MNRQEKIESIRRGEAVIKNDMQGDLRLLSVMNECDRYWNWTYEGSTKAGFYGVNIGSNFNSFDSLFKDQLNNRPQILMSELVEVEDSSCNCKKEQWCSNCYEVKKPMLMIQSNQTEQKEVFTVENMSFDYNDVKTLTDAINKLNQMAFDAYK